MRPYFLMIFLFLHGPAFAIVLDCTENSDGSFHCVETKAAADDNAEAPAAATGAAAVTGTTEATDATEYRKQAELLCDYVAPRKRMSGKGMSRERAMEAEKMARSRYEKCLDEEAKKLRKVAQ